MEVNLLFLLLKMEKISGIYAETSTNDHLLIRMFLQILL
jgi:hypothetical protein